MDLKSRSVTLYGRFTAGNRERLRTEVLRRGGTVSRDFTRRSDVLVVGGLATALIECGALASRIKAAKMRGAPVIGERAFGAALAGEPPRGVPTLGIATASTLKRDDAEILASFDLIVIEGDQVRFSDARKLKTAAELLRQGRSLSDVVRILLEAEKAPPGRHKLVLMPSGRAALKWEDGLSTLQGQGLLPLDTEQGGLDELFEAAQVKEASGDLEEAERLYEMCARADRTDAIALYNLGNVHLSQGALPAAILAYRRAIARDPEFVEARYNLALALESIGNLDEALQQLEDVLSLEPGYSDAVFNQAQILLKSGDIARAKEQFERYLELDPPADSAVTARKALSYCTSRLSA